MAAEVLVRLSCTPAGNPPSRFGTAGNRLSITLVRDAGIAPAERFDAPGSRARPDDEETDPTGDVHRAEGQNES